jgi:hypothetical protein
MLPGSSCLPIALGLIAFGAGSPGAPLTPTLVLQAPPAASVNSVAVSPDGSFVATAGEGGVRLYDAKSGALVRAFGDAGDRSVAFSPDGRSLTAGGFHMDKQPCRAIPGVPHRLPSRPTARFSPVAAATGPPRSGRFVQDNKSELSNPRVRGPKRSRGTGQSPPSR